MTDDERARLIALAERCEAATGDSFDLNHAIAGALGIASEPFTASLDAAMTLVPQGWHSSIHTTEGAELRGSAALRDRDGGPSFTGAAATSALALCAAALRARAALAEPTEAMIEAGTKAWEGEGNLRDEIDQADLRAIYTAMIAAR